jgi:DNA-directed RNA polymerase subunit beta'
VVLSEEIKRSKRTVIVRMDDGTEKEHLVPKSMSLQVANGDYVRAGDPLTAGTPAPHDILRIKGKEDLQEYLIREVQGVYRKQSVPINDKHIEVIVAQMLSKVKIVKEGNTKFIRGSVQDRARVVRENKDIRKKGGQPATFTSLLLGISRASLSSSSFLSAASFQETTKVLTEAALAGQRDNLDGLKENIILGRLIPAGTGYSAYQDTVLSHSEPDFVDEEFEDPAAGEADEPVAAVAVATPDSDL